MPQMEFSDYAPQVIWLVITFAVLYILMAKFALPRIAEVLESREQKITNDIDQAQSLGKEAEAAEKEYGRIASESQSNARRIAEEARNSIKAEHASAILKMEETLSSESLKSDASIAQARAKAMEGLKELATDLTQAATSKLLGAQVSPEHAAKIVNKELERR